MSIKSIILLVLFIINFSFALFTNILTAQEKPIINPYTGGRIIHVPFR